MAKLLLLSGLAVMTLLAVCESTVFTVGDSAGWDTSADLTSWPASKIFSVGDILLFQYSKYHTVNQVGKKGYDACNATNALLTSSDGNTSVPLTAAGDKYFICGTLSHCLGGMKLQLSVRRNQTAASPAPATALPQRPTAATEDDDPWPAVVNGLDHGGRSQLFVTFCCAIGALWWFFMMEI